MFDHPARNRQDQSQPAAPLIKGARWRFECRSDFGIVGNGDDRGRSGAVAFQLAIDDYDAVILLFAEDGTDE